MKLTEQQAFKVMNYIEDRINMNLLPKEKADFVMLELINLELDK